MEPSERTPVDYDKLLRIATATAYEVISPSARSNLADQIASDAVKQYVEAVKEGQEIHSPYGWIKTTARRRALDAIDRWDRDKKATRALDADPGIDYYTNRVSLRLLEVIDGGEEDPGDIAVLREWIAELVEIAYPDDPVNRDIAIACLVEGSRPRDIADDFGMSAKVIGNRLVKIRQRLRAKLPAVDSRF